MGEDGSARFTSMYWRLLSLLESIWNTICL